METVFFSKKLKQDFDNAVKKWEASGKKTEKPTLKAEYVCKKTLQESDIRNFPCVEKDFQR